MRTTHGRTIAVCGLLEDKDVTAVARAMDPVVDEWIAVGLTGPRARDAHTLAGGLEAVIAAPVHRADDVAAGCLLARDMAGPGDRVVVFGSFHTVGPALEWLGLDAAAG